jgi:hypothetical protein
MEYNLVSITTKQCACIRTCKPSKTGQHQYTIFLEKSMKICGESFQGGQRILTKCRGKDFPQKLRGSEVKDLGEKVSNISQKVLSFFS